MVEEKKPYPTGYTFTPNSWSLVFGNDEDGYVVSVTNRKFRSLQLDDNAAVVVKGMVLNLIEFLKTYAKLGDPVDEGAVVDE